MLLVIRVFAKMYLHCAVFFISANLCCFSQRIQNSEGRSFVKAQRRGKELYNLTAVL